jgi:hypothetical protein
MLPQAMLIVEGNQNSYNIRLLDPLKGIPEESVLDR